MMSSYAKRPSKYKNLTAEEWDLKNSFSFDDNHGFSDLKILKMQNGHRFSYMEEHFGLPPDGILGFCTAFSTNNKRNRLIQRHLCPDSCFWDPRHCFLEETHSGNLTDLMKKSYHDKFNPSFAAQFGRNFTGKIDWSLTGGLGHYPSKGLWALIENLGITTKLTYENNEYSVNFDNLSREFRDNIPVRPLYVLEEKKCHDVVDALLKVNREEIERNKKEMEIIYDERYKACGPIRKPILSLMMWGPFAGDVLKKTDRKCDLEPSYVYSKSHVCENYSEKHYWMYTHIDGVMCEKGRIEDLVGPAMTHDMKVIYPCNHSGCNQGCMCDLCLQSEMCPIKEHKKHIKHSSQECIVNRNIECQERQIMHPENLDNKEDIVVEKNIFYHNKKLVDQPRNYFAGKIEFAGIKIKCNPYRLNVRNHFKFHMVIHLQCKYCVYQLKTAFVKTSGINTCWKIFLNINSRHMYWHKRMHTADWTCDECDVEFTRKWTLGRHLKEIHSLQLHEMDDESEEEDIDSSMEIETDSSEDIGIGYSNLPIECKHCNKKFAVQRYLDAHMKVNHNEKRYINCGYCDATFAQKPHLKRHEETVHGRNRSDVLNFSGEQSKIICAFCGVIFSRKDNLHEHVQRSHLKDGQIFSCSYCDMKFDRRWNLNRHEQKCMLSNDKLLDK